MLATAQQTISISTSAASIAVPALATAHVLPAAAAGPIGLAVAGVALALTAILSRKGPKQKVISTQIVNELEPQLQANLAGYMDTRTPASRAQALANFQAAWQFLASSQACGSPDLGNPGRACIADRGRGGKWDWWAMYYDPIAKDTPPEAWPIAELLPAGSLSNAEWLLPAALVVIGALL